MGICDSNGKGNNVEIKINKFLQLLGIITHAFKNDKKGDKVLISLTLDLPVFLYRNKLAFWD